MFKRVRVLELGYEDAMASLREFDFLTATPSNSSTVNLLEKCLNDLVSGGFGMDQ